MPRDFVINGETMVKVKGGAHLSGWIGPSGPEGSGRIPAELGLATGPVTVSPHIVHRDLRADDYGPEIPPEVMTFGADATIKMTLIHFDPGILELCISEAMGGVDGNPVAVGVIPNANNAIHTVPPRMGTLAPAGRILGNGRALFSSGNHYVSLNLLSPQLNYPLRFPSCYLAAPPLEIPLGTEKSAVVLNWRAIPYFWRDGYLISPTAADLNEVVSASGVLWDHATDNHL